MRFAPNIFSDENGVSDGCDVCDDPDECGVDTDADGVADYNGDHRIAHIARTHFEFSDHLCTQRPRLSS
ncbi:MAG: hypothetical protein ACJAYU_002127 [Bradymonadia bacterium]|jgi:hypothetical protein